MSTDKRWQEAEGKRKVVSHFDSRLKTKPNVTNNTIQSLTKPGNFSHHETLDLLVEVRILVRQPF
jgi:hypothetical protein